MTANRSLQLAAAILWLGAIAGAFNWGRLTGKEDRFLSDAPCIVERSQWLEPPPKGYYWERWENMEGNRSVYYRLMARYQGLSPGAVHSYPGENRWGVESYDCSVDKEEYRNFETLPSLKYGVEKILACLPQFEAKHPDMIKEWREDGIR